MTDEPKDLVPVETPFGNALMTPEVAHYVQGLEKQLGEYSRQVMQGHAELSMQKDHMLGLYDIMDRRPRDRRLAQVLCDWMNMHQEKDPTQGWKICPCALCKETKAHMNSLGDPIIHTGRGWECAEGREEFKTRNVAKEFVDNTPTLAPPSYEAEVIEVTEFPPKGEKR